MIEKMADDLIGQMTEAMKQVNKKVLKVVERVMRKEAVYGIDGFPPACLGIWHQPKRPNIKKK